MKKGSQAPPLPPPSTSVMDHPKNSLCTVTLLSLPFTLLALIFIFTHPNDFHIPNLTGFVQTVTVHHSSASSNLTGSASPPPKPDFRLLIGILTMADRYERRHMLRMIYSMEPKTNAEVVLKFVFCKLSKDDQRVLVALEIMKYDDIIILDCEENMDSGKTYSYFSSLRKFFNGSNGDEKPFDYVMKADDDIYLRLPRLVESLKKLPREDLYYGLVVECTRRNAFDGYMSGMAYLVSWDIAEWISTSKFASDHVVGPEDRLTRDWLASGGRAKNRFNVNPAMYDYPNIGPQRNPCGHELVPDTIGVHHLKDHPKWASTLDYFNVTRSLKPSKFHRIS